MSASGRTLVNDVRQPEVDTAEPLVPDSSEMVVEKLKRYKSPGIDQILIKWIQTGGKTVRSKIHERINYIWDKEELPRQWKGSVIVITHEKVIKILC
jgi:hypothetical protein